MNNLRRQYVRGLLICLAITLVCAWPALNGIKALYYTLEVALNG